MRRLASSPISLSCITLVMAAMLTWTGHAKALKPGRHRRIAVASCRATGLPTAFCRRVGRDAYNTDADEWDDLSAHAQRAPGQSACDGAERTVERVGALGIELRTALYGLADSDQPEPAWQVAATLGRALHTIEDNCAHQGMTNPQHAWYSLAAFCEQSNYDPDTESPAYDCAERQTDAIFSVVAELVEQAGVADALDNNSCEPEDSYSDNEPQDPCDEMYLPSPWHACSFLGSADAWDGVDRRWNGEVVSAALLATFSAALHADELPPADLCAGDENALDRPNPDTTLDTSDGPRSCGLAHLVCVGKADGSTDATEAFYADDDSATPPSAPPAASCSIRAIGTTRSRVGSRWLLHLLTGALGLLAARRRRQ